MKKYLFLALGGIVAFAVYCIDFQILKKGSNKTEIIIEDAIDSIYFDVRDGKPYQNFMTNEGLKSYRLDSIEHIDLNGGSYLKVKYHNMTVPYNWWFTNPISPMEDGNFKNFSVLIDGESYPDLFGELLHGSYEPQINFKDNAETRHTVVYKAGEFADTCIVTSLPRDEKLYGDYGFFYSEEVADFAGTHFVDELIVVSDKHTLEIPVDPRVKGMAIESIDECEWMKAYPSEDGIIRLEFEENEGSDREISALWKAESQQGTIAGRDLIITQMHKTHSPEEGLAALRDLYDACGGENWLYTANWWSDLPIYKWESVNSTTDGYEYRTDRLIYLNLGPRDRGNGHTGMLPESFTVLLDNAKELKMNGGNLSGRFPHAITHHERWSEFGWNIICQMGLYDGYHLDFTDINLQLPDAAIWNYKEKQETSTITELKKHKLSWVIHVPADETKDIPSKYINKYLDYAPKGLGLIFVRMFFPHDQYYWRETIEEVENKISTMESEGVPEDIIWVDNFIRDKGLGDNNNGNMSLFDAEGNLLWHGNRVKNPFDEEADAELQQVLIDEFEPIIRSHLGDPVSHDPYSPSIYTSTDYSTDGQLIELQKASEGNGVNVVFLGDGFLDTDMEPGGKYEQNMHKAMEGLFMIEPMISLRKYFNVYTVKVVSPNKFGAVGGKQSINQDINKAAEYILRAMPDMNIAATHICVIENRKGSDFFSSHGFADFLADGGSFAIIETTVEDQRGMETVLHETAGHGIGCLLDEYIHSGYDDNRLDDEDAATFPDYFKEEYHNWGWGLNLSTTDNPAEIPWAHMLADEHYRQETGVYTGALFWPYNIWRSSENSAMRTDCSYFNAPSRELIYKHVMQMAFGENWVYDFATFKAWDMATDSSDRALQNAKKFGEAETKEGMLSTHLPRRLIEKNGRFEADSTVTSAFERKIREAAPEIQIVRNGDQSAIYRFTPPRVDSGQGK